MTAWCTLEEFRALCVRVCVLRDPRGLKAKVSAWLCAERNAQKERSQKRQISFLFNFLAVVVSRVSFRILLYWNSLQVFIDRVQTVTFWLWRKIALLTSLFFLLACIRFPVTELKGKQSFLINVSHNVSHVAHFMNSFCRLCCSDYLFSLESGLYIVPLQMKRHCIWNKAAKIRCECS